MNSQFCPAQRVWKFQRITSNCQKFSGKMLFPPVQLDLFVDKRYFWFFAIMISLIWSNSILSNIYPFEGNTYRWCLVASCPHTEDSWVGEMGWRGCALCAFVVCLPCACCHGSARVFPRELYDPQCLIPSMWLGSTRGQNRVQKYVGIVWCFIQENQKFDNASSCWSSIMVWRGSCIEIQFLMNAVPSSSWNVCFCF